MLLEDRNKRFGPINDSNNRFGPITDRKNWFFPMKGQKQPLGSIRGSGIKCPFLLEVKNKRFGPIRGQEEQVRSY
jgi:hypothetical protein